MRYVRPSEEEEDWGQQNMILSGFGNYMPGNGIQQGYLMVCIKDNRLLHRALEISAQTGYRLLKTRSYCDGCCAQRLLMKLARYLILRLK